MRYVGRTFKSLLFQFFIIIFSTLILSGCGMEASAIDSAEQEEPFVPYTSSYSGAEPIVDLRRVIRLGGIVERFLE